MKYLLTKTSFFLLIVTFARAEKFHIDPTSGNDSNDGKSAERAWKSLIFANQQKYQPGDEILLKRGASYLGGLSLNLQGSSANPIVIASYGDGKPPMIDARGLIAGVHLKNSHYVIVRDLEITADGGKTTDGSPPGFRYGVYVQAIKGDTSNVVIENLTISKIYPEVARKHEGANPTTFLGSAISIDGEEATVSSHFVVKNCRMSNVGFKAVSLNRVQQVEVIGNQMTDIGGPGIQPGRVEDLVVRGNTVIRSGSSLDPRMHARGSGIWPWSCQRVLIENNTFMHARGKGDSCGIHIDFNCRDVVVQYNLSVDNEGGFAEILGNDYNCAYRYNISVNDGFRVKKQNGAFQEGKILMTSGFVGSKQPKRGPYNSYIYNNTIFVRENSRSCFSIAPSTTGILVANNIFHVLGKTVNVLDDQDARNDKQVAVLKRAIVSHNLYITDKVTPPGLPYKDINPIFGDANFKKPGGFTAEDYIPQNASLIKDAGIEILPLPGSDTDLKMGLKVTKDFFGNPIVGKPDLGAIELK